MRHMNTWKAGLWLCLLAAQPWAVAVLRAAPTSTQVYCEIGARIEHANAALEIPYNAHRILFDIGDSPDTFPQRESRVRYRLNGIEPDWQQKRDEMSFTVIFYNAIGDQVRQQVYIVNGKSPGWCGSVERSTFTHRHETLVVPPGAEQVGVVISSAGPPTTVGVYIVDDVRVVQDAGEHGGAEAILDSRPFQTGSGGSASGWIRTGRHPSMARMIPLPGGASQTKAFCIQDDDPASYAEWASVRGNSPRVTPGRRVSIDWNEIYDTGMAKWSRVAYPMPPPGRYRFTVQEVDFFDNPLPTENTIAITVLPPYWRDPWFWGKCGCGAGLLIFLGARYWRHTRNRLRLQRVRLVEQERMRIARDLHDDLGARLTHITLMSAFAASNTSAVDPNAKLGEISTMSRDLVASLSEVVWAVNPENDRLESMIHYLCQLIQRLCQPSPIKCRIDEVTGSAEYAVSSQVRHHVVLAVKEAVNNAIKHSEATELHARIRFNAPVLTISITDNGKGLPPEPHPEGNGIRNMRNRIALVNGSIGIESADPTGTRVHFELPIC